MTCWEEEIKCVTGPFWKSSVSSILVLGMWDSMRFEERCS